MDSFVIDVSEPLENFKHFVDSDDRLILSSGFGGGKTYFINEFKKRYSSEYNFFTLYPINYVVSDNESILEYIKRDICFQLAKDYCINHDSFSLKGFLNDLKDEINFQELILLLSAIPQISGMGFVSTAVASLPFQKIHVFKLLSKNKYSSEKYINYYFEKAGSIYDDDVYTKFIRKILESFRSIDNKKTVLIIEDMDRIDPGHMFNILNIFGSHIDRHFIDSADKTNNKFGFDKLITVMSYKNCQRLYESKYGDNVDFEGYITKFLSSRPFEYSITASARNMLAKKLYSLLELNDQRDREEVQREICRKLDRLSVRDIERIFLFDPDTIIKHQPFFDINGLRVSRDCNILKVYAYETMFGISLLGYDYHHSFKSHKTNAQLFIPLYILCAGEIRDFDIDKELYKVEAQFDDNGCVASLKAKHSSSINSPWYNLSGFEEMYLFDKRRAISECYYSYSNEIEDIDSTTDNKE